MKYSADFRNSADFRDPDLRIPFPLTGLYNETLPKAQQTQGIEYFDFIQHPLAQTRSFEIMVNFQLSFAWQRVRKT